MPSTAHPPTQHYLRLPEGELGTIFWCLTCLTSVLVFLGVFVFQSFARTLISVLMPIVLYRQFSDSAKPPSEPVELRQAQTEGDVQILHNLVSREEAAHFIKQARAAGLDSPTDPGYRSCSRVLMMGDQVAGLLWKRVSRLLPSIKISPTESSIDQPESERVAGHWEPLGLNPCWRICRYGPGQHHAPRTSGVYHPTKMAQVRSVKTLEIHLSDVPEAAQGETRFLKGDYVLTQTDGSRLVAPKSAVMGSIRSSCGQGVVFNHGLLREDTELKAGEKWVMFTDIVYQQVDQAASHEIVPSEGKAMALYQQALKLLELKHFEGGHDLYQRAKRLSPTVPALEAAERQALEEHDAEEVEAAPDPSVLQETSDASDTVRTIKVTVAPRSREPLAEVAEAEAKQPEESSEGLPRVDSWVLTEMSDATPEAPTTPCDTPCDN